jgi:hypothetical protein
MPSRLWRRVALVRADVSEECSVLQLLVTANVVPRSLIFYPDDGGGTFLLKVGSYKSHTASHSRRRHSSQHFLFYTSRPWDRIPVSVLEPETPLQVLTSFPCTNLKRTDFWSQAFWRVDNRWLAFTNIEIWLVSILKLSRYVFFILANQWLALVQLVLQSLSRQE